MYGSKKQIDQIVRNSFLKLNEEEKSLRSYRIADLYYNIGEYSSALEYIQRYIQVNDKNPAAYKVLGQCYEKLKRPDKQLQAYQRSLELNKKQTDLLVEVCKLLQNNELSDVTPAKARYWYELAESRNIHDSAVLNLKLKFMNGGDQTGVQDIILKEIVRRPLDIGLRNRLVYHFLDQNRVDDAFKYVSDIEMKPNSKFRNSNDWYSTVSLVLDKYKEKNSSTINKNWPYWLLLITTIERQLFFTLVRSPKNGNTIDHNLLEATNLLFELDQNLNKVATVCSFPDSERDLASEFLSHFSGQLSLHTASLLFKREAEQSQRGNGHETTKSTLPLLLLAVNFGSIDGNQLWLRNASEATKQLVDLWQAQSSFRVSQAARTLQSCISTSANSDNAVLANFRKICTDKYSVWSNQDDVLNEIRSTVADSDWRKKLYRNLFGSKEQQNASSGSHFIKSTAFHTPRFEWPDVNNLTEIELKSHEADPSNLAHLVYLALGNDLRNNSKQSQITIDPEFKCGFFKNLNFSTVNLMNCSAETLSKLDIDTFLYATTLQTKRNISMENTVPESNKPKILPYANMASILTTDEQSDWWTAAYKIYQNIAGDELAELRATLQYGIEAVRGVGTPKMDLIILLKLGQIFSKKAQETSKSVERGFLEDRSEALFKFSLYMLRVQYSSRSTSEPFRRLFKYTTGNNNFEIEQEVNTLAEEAITFLAGRYFSKNAFKECIEDMAGIKLPFATYFQAESYRKLTEISDTPKKNKRAYLDKARDYLKQTLDLLDEPNVDKNHPLKSIVNEDIKRLHNETSKLETNQSMSDSFVSANGRSDLEESGAHSRYDRDTETATPVPHSGYENIERMIRQMMESLNILKEDVVAVRNRVGNIEEQVNNDDSKHHDKKYFQLNARKTPNTGFTHQNQMCLNNSFNMNPLMNNIYGQMQINPFQAAAVNAANQNYNQSSQLGANFQPIPILPYGNEVYNLHQQMIAQQFANVDKRSPNLMGLSQQPQHQTPPTQPQLVQQSYAMTNPLASELSPVAPSVQPTALNAQPSLDQGVAASVTQTAPQKKWNTSFKNTPVEKGPLVNVVITSSDPVPQNISSITTQASLNFSVTIPPQHIKNNPAVPKVGAALANPTIASTVTVPKSQEQKSIFGNLSKPASSTPFSSPRIKLTPDTKKTETPKTEATKPSPFASFSNIDYEPTAHFEPVIPLPDLIEVKTGEENEITLFEHRAELFRYVKETKEWKERGIGKMKILVNKEDTNKVRLLMRREQVLKLCCNQYLAKATKFINMPKTKTSFTWFGQDYSENELQVQILAIRFKSADICKQFHQAILSAQDFFMTDTISKPAKSDRDEKGSNKPTETKGFGDQFKPKAGSWSCEMCYVSSKAEDAKCVSCVSPKDKNAPQESSKAGAPKSTFSFGNLSTLNAAKPAASAQNTIVVFSANAPNFGFGNLGAVQNTLALANALGSYFYSFSFGSKNTSATPTMLDVHNLDGNPNSSLMLIGNQTPKSSQILKNNLQLNTRTTPNTAFIHQNHKGLKISLDILVYWVLKQFS